MSRTHRVSHVNLAGDGGGDEGGAVFLQPLHRLLHLPHQRVQLRRLPVQIRGDGGLFGEGWERGVANSRFLESWWELALPIVKRNRRLPSTVADK